MLSSFEENEDAGNDRGKGARFVWGLIELQTTRLDLTATGVLIVLTTPLMQDHQRSLAGNESLVICGNKLLEKFQPYI